MVQILLALVYSLSVAVLVGRRYFFKKSGFTNVLNSDLSLEAAKTSKELDSSLKTDYVNAESLPYQNNSFDLVVVQDGLHHLPRPVLGFNEMLRLAKKAVIVIEPRASLVGNLIGTQFEKIDDTENYVFRWSEYSFQAAARSYLLRNIFNIKFISLWDHNVVIRKCVRFFPKSVQVALARLLYRILDVISFCGNMMIGIVIKES